MFYLSIKANLDFCFLNLWRTLLFFNPSSPLLLIKCHLPFALFCLQYLFTDTNIISFNAFSNVLGISDKFHSIPTGKNISCDGKFISRHKKFISCHKKFISRHKKFISCHKKFISCHRKFISCHRNKKRRPHVTGYFSCTIKTISCHWKFISCDWK